MLAIEPPVAAKVLHSALFGWRDTATLTEEDLEEIWRFSSRFFDRSREDYLRMIRAADEVCVLRRESEIAGFAAVRYFDVREDGRTHRLIHGITIQLAPELRGHHFFLLASLSRILRSRLRAPTASFYAFWSAGTPATYIQVYRACAEIWPRPNVETPTFIESLLEAAVRSLGYDDWAAADRVIKRQGAVKWKSHGRDASAEAQALVDWYRELNPDHEHGATLCCIVPLHLKNTTRGIRHALRGAIRPRSRREE